MGCGTGTSVTDSVIRGHGSPGHALHSFLRKAKRTRPLCRVVGSTNLVSPFYAGQEDSGSLCSRNGPSDVHNVHPPSRFFFFFFFFWCSSKAWSCARGAGPLYDTRRKCSYALVSDCVWDSCRVPLAGSPVSTRRSLRHYTH